MRTLLFVVTIIFMYIATPIFAADDAQDADADDAAAVEAEDEAEDTGMILEEVVVRGIKSSMRDAIVGCLFESTRTQMVLRELQSIKLRKRTHTEKRI
jgi:hypothetical protein